MQKLDSQREKSMEGTMNPVEFYMISGFFQVLCICFPFIPERVIFCSEDQSFR